MSNYLEPDINISNNVEVDQKFHGSLIWKFTGLLMLVVIL